MYGLEPHLLILEINVLPLNTTPSLVVPRNGNDPFSTPYQDVANPSQLTGHYLAGPERIELPSPRS